MLHFLLRPYSHLSYEGIFLTPTTLRSYYCLFIVHILYYATLVSKVLRSLIKMYVSQYYKFYCKGLTLVKAIQTGTELLTTEKQLSIVPEGYSWLYINYENWYKNSQRVSVGLWSLKKSTSYVGLVCEFINLFGQFVLCILSTSNT